MATMISYMHTESEALSLRKTVLELAAYLDENLWDVRSFSRREEFADAFDSGVSWELMCYDVAPAGSVDTLERCRGKDSAAKLLLVADADTSPLSYIRPGILASALLIRPVDRKELVLRLKDIYRALRADSAGEGQSSDDAFSFKSSGDTMKIRYADILYFEARNKKLYLRTKQTEYAFYDTLDNLVSSLPERFVRCHKGVIVNSAYITQVSVSKGEICLGDIVLPLSRSYKQLIKESVL